MHRSPIGLVALLCLLLSPTQAAPPRLHLQPVLLEQLDSPTVITHAGDGSGRLFVCDQPGKIWILRKGYLQPQPFLDLTSTGLNRAIAQTTAGSERGLLGLAFHPDYEVPSSAGEGRFYVYFSAPSATNMNPSSPENHISVISEFRVSTTNPDLADPTSERVVLTFGQPQGNHNGGQLAFGPDGFLYIGAGDGGGANDNGAGHTDTGMSGPLGNGLNRTKLLGKILRIDPLGTNGPGGSYGIPASNPFVGEGGGVREEIYAYGLRNPWRFSFDSRPGGTNRLFCGDVGQGRVEEVNLIVSGGNYGWRYREGSFEFDSAMVTSGKAPMSWIDPIAEYAHPGVTIGSPALPQLGLSITGGYVYRGAAIPDLTGFYVFADYRAATSEGGRLMALEEDNGDFIFHTALPLTEASPLENTRRIQTLGEDEAGELYIGTKTNGGVLDRAPNGIPAGGIYKLVAATETTVTLSADRDTSIYESTSNSNGAGVYLYSGRTGGMGGESRRRALLRFDLSSLPQFTDFTGASVVLHHNLGGAAPTTLSLHRVLADWGQAGSNAGTPGGQGAPAQIGDATWFHRFHNTQTWSSNGGDFTPGASATLAIPNLPDGVPLPRTWAGAGLLADLQSWIDTPASNFGWILIGDESGTPTAQRFESRESTTAGGTLRPRLEVSLLAAPSDRPFDLFLATHYPDRLRGEPIDFEVDEDGDEIGLLLEHGYGFSPLQNDTATGLTVTRSNAGGDTLLTMTFRRNPAATDLRLTLRAGTGFDALTTYAESVAGAAPTPLNGASVVSDLPISGQAPARLVTVTVTLNGVIDRAFVRLEADLLP